MKFHHISLRVRDFEASLKFYTTLTKLQGVRQFSAGGGNAASLQNAEGETEIELIAMILTPGVKPLRNTSRLV